jgi:glycosyltransferase involved in cell wall biosynthesis
MDAMTSLPLGSAPGTAKHIAILVHSLSSGGAQRRLVTLANGFAEAGREVDFVSLRAGGEVDRLLDPRVRCTVLTDAPVPRWKPWFLEGRAKLAEWIERSRPDVLIAGTTAVHFSAVAACKKLGEPPLLVLRASRHPVRFFPWSRPHKKVGEPMQRWMRRRAYDAADVVLAPSRETADALKTGLRHPERCIHVANPVLTREFLESLGNPAPHRWFAQETPVVLGVGRLAREKRFDLLIEALAIARCSRDLRLVILGEGYWREKHESQIRRLGLKDAVHMPGNVPDVGAWMAHADLLVSTSAFEGSPAVLIEALAAGLPIVATRCPGGSAELLEDGAAGALIPMDDPQAAAAAMLETIGRPRDRDAIRRLALKHSEGASVAEHLKALDRLASGRAAPAPSLRTATAD